MLPFQHITKLHRHIGRQLAEWAWQMDTAGSERGRARCSGAAAALSIPLWLWGAHQIINCQYGSDKAANQQQMTSSASSCSSRSTGKGDCIATDVDVTMSKARARSDKCFYNCQMALTTLWGWHAGNPFLYLAQGFDNVQQRDDEANCEDDQNDGSADDVGNIVSVAELCDDLTATAGAPAAAPVASAATAPLKRQHQQLSATLAKVGVPVSPDQRLLMTWHELAGRAVRILC